MVVYCLGFKQKCQKCCQKGENVCVTIVGGSVFHVRHSRCSTLGLIFTVTAMDIVFLTMLGTRQKVPYAFNKFYKNCISIDQCNLKKRSVFNSCLSA